MKNLVKNLFIKPTTTIRQAMQTINRAAENKLPVGITLVVGNNSRLIGTVTDGDIRKALVRGADLNEPVLGIMAKHPITVEEGSSVDEMIRTVIRKVKESGRFRDYKVDKVIVTDRKNRVVDLLDFYELWYKQQVKYKKICIVGSGHVGLTLLVVLAEAGYHVVGFDVNRELVQKLNKADIYFYEKGLKPLLKFHLKKGNVRFTSSLHGENADIYIICVGTPIDDKTKNPLVGHIVQAAKNISKILKRNDLVILRSTVPIGTTRKLILPILEKGSFLKAGIDFYLAYAPERVVEGRALEETRQIPQIVGGIDVKSAQEASRVFQVVSPSVIIMDSCEEAETIKLMNNTFRDLSFSFSNKMVLMCEKLGLDTVKVIQAANKGYPRNNIPLPSPGVGGYCLNKDPYILTHVANEIKVGADIFLQGRKINSRMPGFVASKVLRFIQQNKLLKKKKLKIYILGFAFKGYPETSDMRNSSTLDVLNILRRRLKKNVEFCGYDPFVARERIEELKVKYLKYKEGFKSADCVLVMNNNPQFAEFDIFSLLETMRKPSLFFDGWYFFSPQEISAVKGITYQGLGGFD